MQFPLIIQDKSVSIWMITYNHESYIQKCLESVLMQITDFPIEVIIGEDCSTDKTRSIVEEFQKQYPNIIKPIFHEKNVGAMRNAYEYCVPQLRGKYIACLEGDDFWTDPYKLKKQVDFLENNPGYSITFHNLKVIYENGSKSDHLYNARNQRKTTSLEDLSINNYIGTLSCVFRNGLIPELPEWLLNVGIADYALHLLNAKKGLIRYFKEPMGVYRIHDGGAWSTKPKIETSVKLFEMISFLKNEFEGKVLQNLIFKQFNLFIKIMHNKNVALDINSFLNRNKDQIIQLLGEVYPINYNTYLEAKTIRQRVKNFLVLPKII